MAKSRSTSMTKTVIEIIGAVIMLYVLWLVLNALFLK